MYSCTNKTSIKIISLSLFTGNFVTDSKTELQDETLNKTHECHPDLSGQAFHLIIHQQKGIYFQISTNNLKRENVSSKQS